MNTEIPFNKRFLILGVSGGVRSWANAHIGYRILPPHFLDDEYSVRVKIDNPPLDNLHHPYIFVTSDELHNLPQQLCLK